MDKPFILVIDDEINLLRFFEYNIKGLGYGVVTGQIGEGLLVLAGFGAGDNEVVMRRIERNRAGKFNSIQFAGFS